MKLTYAFCTYNRAERLERLVSAIRAQCCPIPFDILAVNNNSGDNTLEILQRLAGEPGPALRVATETSQGIVPARNRAVQEALDSDILVFIDDDETPQAGVLNAVYDAIANEGADCVGGHICLDLAPEARPGWLDDEVAGFLGQLEYGSEAFWIKDSGHPLWTGNIAYRTSIFRDDPDLRFDPRYNREGTEIGGGEDHAMFRTLLARQVKIRYRPDMQVAHSVEPWKLRRRYFLYLHYLAGKRKGRHELPGYPRQIFGIPPFLFAQALRHMAQTCMMLIAAKTGCLRQAMNMTHAFGMIHGAWLRRREAASR